MKKLGLIGYGNMASAIADAIMTAEALELDDIEVYDVSPTACQRAVNKGFSVAPSLSQLCRDCEMLLLAVKPNMVASVLREAGSALEGKALMSIAAGVSSKKLKEFGGTYFLRILRIMPNTPAMVGAGTMVLCNDTDFTPEERKRAEELMGAVGIVEWIEEKHMDAVTGLSGSGPAYVAMFIEALADGGVQMGLSRQSAMNLAMQTVYGTAKLLQEKGMHPGQLKDMVCSPGGTTIEGVRALESSGFRYTTMEAVIQATEKSKRLI